MILTKHRYVDIDITRTIVGATRKDVVEGRGFTLTVASGLILETNSMYERIGLK